MKYSLKQLRPLKCQDRVHCRACRTDPDWCERVIGDRDFQCPFGVTYDEKTDSIIETKNRRARHPQEESLNMKVTSLSKIQVQEKQKALLGTSFIEELNAASIGHTAKDYLIPSDKFIMLKKKYDLVEEDQTTPLDSEPTVEVKKVLTKSKPAKRKCSACSRKRK